MRYQLLQVCSQAVATVTWLPSRRHVPTVLRQGYRSTGGAVGTDIAEEAQDRVQSFDTHNQEAPGPMPVRKSTVKRKARWWPGIQGRSAKPDGVQGVTQGRSEPDGGREVRDVVSSRTSPVQTDAKPAALRSAAGTQALIAKAQIAKEQPATPQSQTSMASRSGGEAYGREPEEGSATKLSFDPTQGAPAVVGKCMLMHNRHVAGRAPRDLSSLSHLMIMFPFTCLFCGFPTQLAMFTKPKMELHKIAPKNGLRRLPFSVSIMFHRNFGEEVHERQGFTKVCDVDAISRGTEGNNEDR